MLFIHGSMLSTMMMEYRYKNILSKCALFLYLPRRPWDPPKNPQTRTRRKVTRNTRFRLPPLLGRSCGLITSTTSETTAYLAPISDRCCSKISFILQVVIQLKSHFRTLAAHATVHLFRPTEKPILTGRNSEFHRFAHQWLEFC